MEQLHVALQNALGQAPGQWKVAIAVQCRCVSVHTHVRAEAAPEGDGAGAGLSCGSLVPGPHTRPSAHSTTDVHTVASLLKLYLRELPEPVVPFARYEDFLSCAQLLTKDEGEVSGSWGRILGGGPASWWGHVETGLSITSHGT